MIRSPVFQEKWNAGPAFRCARIQRGDRFGFFRKTHANISTPAKSVKNLENISK
jgi:hypothetical protein